MIRSNNENLIREGSRPNAACAGEGADAQMPSVAFAVLRSKGYLASTSTRRPYPEAVSLAVLAAEVDSCGLQNVTLALQGLIH